MERIKNKKLAGGAFIATSLILFGKETLLWAWNRILDAISNGAGGEMSVAAIPWQNLFASLFGLAGMGLLFWPSKKKPSRKVSRGKQLQDLAYHSMGIVERVQSSRETKWFYASEAEDVLALARDAHSLMLFFRKAGLPVPDIASTSAEKYLVGVNAYVSTLIPLMRDGHVAEAEAAAPIASSEAEKIAKSFKPENWYAQG